MKQMLRLVACGLVVAMLAVGARAESPAETVDAVMTEYARLEAFSGTVLVARGGDIVYAKAFGEANKDHHAANILETRFNIGSIGKTFTGVAVMQLAELGRIELDDPVTRYLPEFPYGDKITIHHLLSHSSGLANYMAHPQYRARMPGLRAIDDLLPLIYDQELLFHTPGAAYSYSNSGIVVLGAVIEKVSGQAYAQYLQEHILAPSGMMDTGINFWDQVVPNRATGYTRSFSGRITSAIFQVPPASADGGIETTVLDMLRFDRALYGDVLLSEESKRKMFTPNLQGYGYCWRISENGGHRSIGHGGGAPGVSASFMRYPDDDVTIIVLSNLSEGAERPSRTLEAVVFGLPYDAPRRSLGEVLYRDLTEGRIEGAAGVESAIEREGADLHSSVLLNQLGYELLVGGDVDQAIAVFEVNAARFPDDPNCFDSLAEAHLAKGDRDRAIALYRKALEVDPTFPNPRRMLEQLTAAE